MILVKLKVEPYMYFDCVQCKYEMKKHAIHIE